MTEGSSLFTESQLSDSGGGSTLRAMASRPPWTASGRKSGHCQTNHASPWVSCISKGAVCPFTDKTAVHRPCSEWRTVGGITWRLQSGYMVGGSRVHGKCDVQRERSVSGGRVRVCQPQCTATDRHGMTNRWGLEHSFITLSKDRQLTRPFSLVLEITRTMADYG